MVRDMVERWREGRRKREGTMIMMAARRRMVAKTKTEEPGRPAGSRQLDPCIPSTVNIGTDFSHRFPLTSVFFSRFSV